MATVKVSSELLDKFKSHMDADVLGSPDSIKLSPALVLAVALLYMMASDGEIEEAESSQLQSVVGNNDELLSCALAYVQSVSIEAFLDKAPEALNQQDKLCILVNVFDSLLADGRADQEELDLFHQMRSAFGISESAFKESIQVITLKNDKSVLGPFEPSQAGDSRISPHLALAVSLLYMMSADGSIGTEEIGQLEAVIGEFEGLQQVALAYVRKVKRGDFFKAVSPVLKTKQKLCILTNVCDSMMSDGTVAVVEDKLFLSMVAAFGFKLKDFDTYHHVLETKNIRPFDTSKFRSHSQHALESGAKGQDGEIFGAQGAATELGEEVRRTMHDNIDRVQHDFGSEANIQEVNHNATDELNIQPLADNGMGELNIQQVNTDSSAANVQQVDQQAMGVNLQQVNLGANGVAANLQQVDPDAMGVNLQQVNTESLGANLQQVNGDPAQGNSAQWIAGAAPEVNRQALETQAQATERQRLALDTQTANLQTLDAATEAQNRQAIAGEDVGSNRALIDADSDLDHRETLPPEARVKNLFQDIEVLSRQLDDFESKNKGLLNEARRARAQEEANQQALINQQWADNAIAVAQASSAQALGVPKQHLQSNLQDLGTQAFASNLQPLAAPEAATAHPAQIGKDPIAEKSIGSAQSHVSQGLGVPKQHLQSNVQDVGLGVVKVNRQLIQADSAGRDLALDLGATDTQRASAASAPELLPSVAPRTPAENVEVQAASAAAAKAVTHALRGMHGLLDRSTRARRDFKVYVKLTLTFFVLSFWTSNISAIHPLKQRTVSGSLVRLQQLDPQATVPESLAEL